RFVRELFERSAAGESLRSLAAWADTTEHKPRRSRLWLAASIRVILINPAYYGEAAYGKRGQKRIDRLTKTKKNLKVKEEARPDGEGIGIPVPPIVSRALWDAVQERLSANKGGRPSNQWPLTGVVSCGTCRGIWGDSLCAFGREQKGRR